MPSEWTTFSQHLSTILKAHDSLRVSLVGLVGLCHAKALCVSALQPCSAQLFEVSWRFSGMKKEGSSSLCPFLTALDPAVPLSELPDLLKPQLQAAAGCRRTKPSSEARMNNLHSLPVLASAQSHTSS